MIDFLSIIIISYLLGSLPTSIIAGHWLKSIDIRDHGSGNAGATNVFRVLGWKAGLVVSLIDIFKGIVAVVYVVQIQITGSIPFSIEIVQIGAGFAAVVGHIWTIFAGFRGGKGVATAAGMMIGLYPLAMLFAFIVFGLVLWLTRYVSLASMLGACSVPVILQILASQNMIELNQILFYFSCIIALLIVLTHTKNIKRLIAGVENKVGKKSA